MGAVFVLALISWCGTALVAAEPQFELHGTVSPPQRVVVTLYGIATPFHRRAFSGSRGRFSFKRVPSGIYTVSVSHPRLGESHTTIEITKSFADTRGRVETSVSLMPSAASVRQALIKNNTVDVRDLSISPKANSLLKKAQRKLGRGRTDAASRDLERAVSISDKFVEAWNLMGTIYYQREKYQRAEELFRKAVLLNKDAFEPVVNLGGTLLSMKRPTEALPYNDFAVSARPESALANVQMGINYFLLGKDRKALRYLNKAKQLDPSHSAHPQLILAQIHSREGRPYDARQELEDFLLRHPDSHLSERVRVGIERLTRSGSL